MFALLIGMSAAVPSSAEVWTAGRGNPEGQFAFGVSGGLVEPYGQLGNVTDLSVSRRSSGLDLRYGWSGSAYGDFYMTSFLTAGLWCGLGELRMRDQVLPAPPGTTTVHELLRARTSLVGAHVKGFLPTERSWTPFAFVGVSRAVRRVVVSRDLLLVAPGTEVFAVTDDGLAFDVGLGFEQRLNHSLGMTARATYLNAGALGHDLPWAGGNLAVRSWEFWSLEVGIEWHVVAWSGRGTR